MHQTISAVSDDRRFFTGMALVALLVVLAMRAIVGNGEWWRLTAAWLIQ